MFVSLYDLRFDTNPNQNLLYYTHRFTVGYVDDFEDLPFSLDALRRHLERLIIVSDPAQVIIALWMRV